MSITMFTVVVLLVIAYATAVVMLYECGKYVYCSWKEWYKDMFHFKDIDITNDK